MSITLTRDELHEHIWSRPMKRLAEDWGVTATQIREACEKAGVPRPGHGYWTLMEMGRTPERAALEPAAGGYSDPLTVAELPRRRQAASGVAISATKKAPGATVSEEPARPAGTAAREPVAPDTPDAPTDAEPSAESEERLATGETSETPTSPTTLTREELYEEVWRTPMFRLAPTFGVTGNGLAKICDRAGVPYPSRGYWAKLASGQAPERPPLPPRSNGIAAKVTIRPTPQQPPPTQLPPEVIAMADAVRTAVAKMPVPQRLNLPHPVIAGWLREREERRRDARRESAPWLRTAFMPADFTELDRRKQCLLDVLFKALERHDMKVREDSRDGLFAEAHGEKIHFAIREKSKQVRRPLNEDERRHRRPGERDWKPELQPTGCFSFQIKTYLPSGFAREWLETDAEPFETLIPDIAAVIVSVGPVLAEQSRRRAEVERQRHIEQLRRHEEEQRRKKDANRWRRFMALARSWSELELARAFIDALKAASDASLTDADRKTTAEGIAWAEEQLVLVDPIAEGPAPVFRDVASINEWSYDDEGRLRSGY